MNSYTTIEQSEKLLELGFNPNTADMFYIFDPFVGDIGGIGIGKPEEVKDVPCWSLGALISLMPEMTMIVRDATTKHASYFVDFGPDIHVTQYYDTAIEAVFDAICWLLENNFIKE